MYKIRYFKKTSNKNVKSNKNIKNVNKTQFHYDRYVIVNVMMVNEMPPKTATT